MSDIVNWMQQLPEPDRLALSTRYALLKAQLDATRMRAEEIQPEHLLLGLIKQNDARIMQMCASLEMDLVPIYKHFILAQPAAQQWTQSFYKESLELEYMGYQEWRQRRREELLKELKPGEIRRGVVSNIANFGIFVDLGGVEGLVHVSQLAWSPVNHPSELFKVGQEVEVQVLSVDKEKKKIALSIKRAQADPWKTVEQRYKVGQVVTGEGEENLPFSQESLECLDWAISFAKHIHSTVAYPDHLLLSILLQKRIQSFLAPLLPPSDKLLAYFTDEKMPDSTKLASSQAGICPSCKQSTLPGWKHCVYCGASLARVCPQCGAPYPEIEGAQFCFECGGKLEA